MFDPTSAPLLRWNFTSVGVTAVDGSFTANGKEYKSKALTTLMRERGHKQIDILKLDIESAEWDLLEKTPWSELCIGQVLVELHDFRGITLVDLLDKYFAPLESAGFRLFSIEPVCASCSGQYEIGFIHLSWSPDRGFDKQCKLP